MIMLGFVSEIHLHFIAFCFQVSCQVQSITKSSTIFESKSLIQYLNVELKMFQKKCTKQRLFIVKSVSICTYRALLNDNKKFTGTAVSPAHKFGSRGNIGIRSNVALFLIINY